MIKIEGMISKGNMNLINHVRHTKVKSAFSEETKDDVVLLGQTLFMEVEVELDSIKYEPPFDSTFNKKIKIVIEDYEHG